MFNKNSFALAASLVAGALASGAVSAATVTATGGYGAGSFPTEAISGTVGIATPIGYSGYAGVAQFNRTGGTASQSLLPLGVFYAICLEFNEYLAGDPKTWELGALSAAPDDANNNTPTGMGPRANDMARLLNGAYSNWGSALTQVQATALQLAVWEVSIESTGTYNLTSGLIKFDPNSIDANALTLANSYLADLGPGGSFNDATMYYMALTSDGAQDFVVKTVPLPAAAWLLLSGLIGFGALGRRRVAS